MYPAWWASLNVPATPHCAGAATEAIMPGAVPGLVGMLLGLLELVGVVERV